MIEEISKCRNCSLYCNQLPLLDKLNECDVMWVGLSAKKVKNIDINYPLEEDTNSGKIIKEVEDALPYVKFYKTNLVKCLPLNDLKKIRYPNKVEMNACINNLIKEIEYLNPKLIFLLGNNVANFFERYFENYNMKFNINIKRIEHPSYIYIYKRNNKQDYINKLTNDINSIF